MLRPRQKLRPHQRNGVNMNQPLTSSDPRAQSKEEAAKRAVRFVQSGMKVGLGTGSTAVFATRCIAELLKTGELTDIAAFGTSKATAEEALRLGIPMLPEDLDLTIDSADEADPDMNLIKGGGGALLREKIVAQVSQREIIVVDETKPSPRLGTYWPVPVEVIPFGWRPHAPSHLTDSIRFLSFVTHGVVVFSAVISGISLERQRLI